MKNQNTNTTKTSTNKPFVVREFQEVPGGYYECDFYYTPNGSFWDDEGYYFNREGLDKHGGYYDNNFKYVPGKDWDDLNQCYPSEVENDYFDDEDDEADDFDDLGYQNFKKNNNYEDDEEGDYYDDYGVEENLNKTNTNLKVESNKVEQKVENKNLNESIPKTITTITNNSTNLNDNKSLISTESDKKVIAPAKKNKLDSLFG